MSNEKEEVKAKSKEEEAKAKAKAEQKALEEAAFDRICKAMGKDPNEIRAAEERKAADIEVEIDLGRSICHINGTPYSGVVRCPKSMAEQLMHMAANRKQRILREQIGYEHILQELNHGGFRMVPVKQVDAE